MKIFRLAALGAGAAWFLHPREGAARRTRAFDFVRGLVGRARGIGERGTLAGRDEEGQGGQRRPPRPDVVEVKSPAELEPGIASSSPDRSAPGRVARPDLRGDRRGTITHGALPDELEPTATEWENDDVTPRVDFPEPPQGSHLTEAHLGILIPREDLEEPARGVRATEDEDAETPRGVPPGPQER